MSPQVNISQPDGLLAKHTNTFSHRISDSSIPDGRMDSSLHALEQALLQTAVIIPARNEESSLPLVLSDLPRVGMVIVANNGSTDSTPELAKEAGCLVVDEPVPGYGKACLAGIAALELDREKATDIRYVAFLDGDYSDHPESLPQLLQPLVNGQADFVLGSRMLGKREPGAMPPQAIWGNRLACFLMWLFWGARYTDLGPFRILRRDTLRSLKMEDQNFGWTIEMQIKATLAKLRSLEIPVPYRRRVGISKISGTLSGTFRAGYKILLTIGIYAWKTRGYQYRTESIRLTHGTPSPDTPQPSEG